MPELHQTPLHDLHLELGAKMGPFAGFALPLHYPCTGLAMQFYWRRASYCTVSAFPMLFVCTA